MPLASTSASPGSAVSSIPVRVRAAASASTEYGVVVRSRVIRSTNRSTGPRTDRTPSAQTAAARNGSSTVNTTTSRPKSTAGSVFSTTNTTNTPTPTGSARSTPTRSRVIATPGRVR